MKDSVKDRFLADPARYAEEAYTSLKQRLLTIEHKYAPGVPRFENLFAFMASAHEKLGLLAYFARGDKTALKQHWYLTAKLLAHSVRHQPEDDPWNCYVSMDTNLLCALVSDSPSVIDEFSRLAGPNLAGPNLAGPNFASYGGNPKAAVFALHLAQLVIRGDYEAAQAKIALGAKKAGGKIKQAYATGTDFYSLLMKGDKAGLEASIMESTRFRKTGDEPYICDFLYPGATFRAKLCWHKGIPVEIEHPMVPMAWMPIQPLPQYDDVYDFLSPNWQPPDQGFMARLSRRFQKSFPMVEACMERVRQIDKHV